MSRCLFIASLLVIAPAMAQNTNEAALLRLQGYSPVGNGVWEHVSPDGAVHRMGFGSASLSTILDALVQHEHDLREDLSKSSDSSSAVGLESLIGSVGQQISAIEDMQARAPSQTKASGDFNGCTTGTLGPTASVSSGTRTATAAVGTTGFGPAGIDLLRLGVASARTGLGTPVVDVEATYGTTQMGGITVSATTATAGTCKLYAYGHNFNTGYQCGRWADAFYNGPC